MTRLGVVNGGKAFRVVFFAILLLLVFLGAGAAVAVAAEDPHIQYGIGTDKCAGCHGTHTSSGGKLMLASTQTQLCFLCHDAGGQSVYNVAAEFKNAASRHPVLENFQKCSSCHSPHGVPDGKGGYIPASLRPYTFPDNNKGNWFCFSCHAIALTAPKYTNAISPNLFPPDGVGHNNPNFSINGVYPFKPPSGTDIRCEGCHEKHGSPLPKLLKQNPNKDGVLASGNDKTFCAECHAGASADGRYQGIDVYNNPTYSKHSLTSSSNTNAVFPGLPSSYAGQCQNCHDPHGTTYGTSKVAMKTLRGVYNDYVVTAENKGTIKYTPSDFEFCFSCHNSSSPNSKYDIKSQYNDPKQGGHRIKTPGGNLAVGSVLPCEACHDIHGSSKGNKYLMKDSLGSGLGNGRNECLACHTAGKVVEGLTMKDLPAGVPQHYDGTTACLDCHGSPHKPSSGISEGGVDCTGCHSVIATAMRSTISGYHHLMNNTSATYATGIDTKNCLSCHVDHNKFNNNKAYNLKQNYTQSFPVTDTSITGAANTDYIAGDTVNGGICLSCHKNSLNKSYPQSGTSKTQPVSIASFAKADAHNYVVISTFGDGSTFNAVCVKCHNDTLPKDKQVSAAKFGLHDSPYQSILTPFDRTDLPNPMNERFCYLCHDGVGSTDPYGVPMSVAAKNVYNVFMNSKSKHDVGPNLACISCHGPHTVSKAKFAENKDTSDISDPDNTLNPFVAANGANTMATFCLKCHDGNPPVFALSDTQYVPLTVTFPSVTFTNVAGNGWNKSAYMSSGHNAKKVYCDACHDKHGSQYDRMALRPEDPATTPTSTSGICLSCHGTTTGAQMGAQQVYADLVKGSDYTYRHPTLFVSGKHTDTEQFPWATADRHAECTDCHDPHTASNTNRKSMTTAPLASGILAGVAGVKPTYGTTAWTAPTSYTLGKVDNEYELCFKCHSNFNGNFPTPPTGIIAETNVALDFNPNNASYHYIGIPGSSSKATTAGKYINGFTYNSVLYCTNCHGSDGTPVTQPGAIHGSNYRYILKLPYDPYAGSQTANLLCYACHDPLSYGKGSENAPTGFRAGNKNLHNIGDHKVEITLPNGQKTKALVCAWCHSAVPHGSKRPHLIVTKNDPLPYSTNNKLTNFYDAAPGNYSKRSCGSDDRACDEHKGY